MKNQDSVTSMVTLANAAELVSRVTAKVCGQNPEAGGEAPMSQEVYLQLSMSNFGKQTAALLGE